MPQWYSDSNASASQAESSKKYVPFYEIPALPWSCSPAETPKDFFSPLQTEVCCLSLFFFPFSWQVHAASPWAQPTQMTILSHLHPAPSEIINALKSTLHAKKPSLPSPAMRKTTLRMVRHCTYVLREGKDYRFGPTATSLWSWATCL